MFTGIIEEVGIVKSINNCTITVEAKNILSDAQIGDSVSINGVCETIVKFDNNFFSANISEETFNVTTFKYLKNGDRVNLERALTPNSRLGGHIVTGHVDSCAKVIDLINNGEFYNLTLEIPKTITKYVVYKGSIAVNGISLTVADINNQLLKVALIPHTFNNTTLKYLNIGDLVNIETDILAKYVEKMVSANNNKENSISVEFLAENGFV